MRATTARNSANPVAFASVLCVLMLGGELIAGRTQNPMALVFYCFLPAAFWMIVQDQRRDAQAITELEARILRFEAARGALGLPKGD